MERSWSTVRDETEIRICLNDRSQTARKEPSLKTAIKLHSSKIGPETVITSYTRTSIPKLARTCGSIVCLGSKSGMRLCKPTRLNYVVDSHPMDSGLPINRTNRVKMKFGLRRSHQDTRRNKSQLGA